MSKSRVTDKTDGPGCDMQETKISLFHRNSVKHHLWTRGASQLPLEWVHRSQTNLEAALRYATKLPFT